MADAEVDSVIYNEVDSTVTVQSTSDVAVSFADLVYNVYESGGDLVQLSDTNITSPLVNQALIYDGSKWIDGLTIETAVPSGAVFTDTTDHTAFTNIGTNTHAQIDTHIADSTKHFLMSAISITESQISDLQNYTLPSEVLVRTNTDIYIPTTDYHPSTKKYVDDTIAGLVDSAPETLDTLNELAAALGDDPNFATTVTNQIAAKVAKSGDTMTGNLTVPNIIVSGNVDGRDVSVDGTKLDTIETNAQVNTVDSVAGKTGIVTLVKGDVGLGNVDNTSDADKPVSTAQQAALDLKLNLAGGTLTGAVARPTATITASSTVSIDNFVTFIDASSADITATLPAAVTNANKVINLKRIDSSGNTVTIDGNGAETIDGELTLTLYSLENITIISNGSNWYAL